MLSSRPEKITSLRILERVNDEKFSPSRSRILWLHTSKARKDVEGMVFIAINGNSTNVKLLLSFGVHILYLNFFKFGETYCNLSHTSIPSSFNPLSNYSPFRDLIVPLIPKQKQKFNVFREILEVLIRTIVSTVIIFILLTR